MSYASLGNLAGNFLVQKPVAGATDIAALQKDLIAALTGGGGQFSIRPECWKAKKLTMDQAKAWVSKYNTLKTMYPTAMAAAKFSPCTAGNDQGYRPWTMDEWYTNQYGSTVTKIDMTPAVNTVPAGTPGSWNVTGTQSSGSLYGYNFADQAAAQAYAQAVVDSGGTATMYQVPPGATPPSSMVTPVTGGTVGSGQYEVIGNAATGTTIASYYADYTSASNFAASVNSAGGNVRVIDTTTGLVAVAPASSTQSAAIDLPQNTTSNQYQAQIHPYVPPPLQANNYPMQSAQGSSSQMTPDQTYNSPDIPASALQPAAPQESGGSMFGMAALLAIPVGAYLYFKHR